MNWEHFKAFLWLRWRLRINQLRRAGTTNTVILAILAFFAVVASAGLFVGGFLVGLFALPHASPAVLMYVWDGLILLFLFSWATGLLADLQRSEILALDKFLHLPVSLTGAFLINYLSSLASLTLILFLPGMLALSLSLVCTRGPAMLLVFPLLAGFLFMVTAITHQFRGWLAALMVNKRRRRTVVVVATLVFVLFFQLPNLVNILQPWNLNHEELTERLAKEQQEAWLLHAAGKLPAEQYAKRLAENHKEHDARVKESERQVWQQVQRIVRIVNLVLPPLWLALGTMDLAEGNAVPALLGTLGLALMGAASLWRSYRTTVRLYTGEFTSGKRQPAAAAPPPTGKSSVRLLEKRLPWLSEQTSAIALTGFRSLTRAPEVKMLFLTPIILVVIFGALFARHTVKFPVTVVPLFAFGAIAMILLSMVQLVGNQFGFDRSGFRVFVLCAARRRDILLGKNLAFAPLALALSAAMIVLLQVVQPMRIDHLLAVGPQMISMYLLFCLLANWLSILAPVPVAAGAMKPANIKGVSLLFHLGFVFLFPLALAPTVLPLGVEALVGWLRGSEGIGICLLLSVIECAAVVAVYHVVLTWQGDLLQAREQKILETVTTKEE